jgi:tight adherence protein C
MGIQLIGTIGLILIGGIILIYLYLTWLSAKRDEADPLQRRLAQYSEDELPSTLEELEMSMTRSERIFVPLFDKLATFVMGFTPENQIETIRLKLERAGKADMEPTSFFAQRIMMTVVFGIGGFAVFFMVLEWPFIQVILASIGGAALGYYLPVAQLDSATKKRQEEIVKALPDALDLMTICVEAGLGFDTAMGKVYEKWDNDLARAFGRVLQEIQLGKLRREALRDMSYRMDVPDVTAFTGAIIQADQLGVSISKILRVQSEQMRIKRRQRAHEKANQAPVKMMIPMVFLIFPSIWVVLMGPAVVLLKDQGFLGGL